MLRIWFKLICISLFLFSCGPEQKKSTSTISDTHVNEAIRCIPASGDSIVPPEIVPAGVPAKFYPEIENTEQSANTIHTALAPQIVPAGKPFTAKPGTGIYAAPQIVKATGRIIPFVQPQPVPAFAARFKDDASFNIQYLDVDQGMPSSYVHKLFQDRSGNIWFASSAGLTKFDGRSFLNFSNKVPPFNAGLRSIFEDKNGNIWICTSKGLCQYNGSSFTLYDQEGGLPSSSVMSIIQDRNGFLWIGTAAGACKFDGTTFTYYTVQQGLPDNSVRVILQDLSGNFWFATGQGICEFDGKTFTSFTEKEGLIKNWITSMAMDKNGNIWVVTESGACQYDGKVFRYYTDKQGLSSNITRSILMDHEGNMWFGCYQGGANKFDGKTFTWLTDKEGLSVNTVWTMMEDTEGNIWFGTDGGGICKYSARSFTHFTAKQGMPHAVITGAEDKSGNIWFGTYSNGIYKYDGNSFRHFHEKEDIFGIVWTIFTDSKGIVWFGSSSSGLVEYDGEKFYRYTTKEGLTDNRIGKILEDEKGNIWISTSNGLNKFNPGTNQFTHYTTKQGLNSNGIGDIVKDNTGNIWIITGKGLNKFDGTAMFHFTGSDLFESGKLKNMAVDPDQDLWIGTIGNGLSRFDAGRKAVMTYSTENGLSDDNIRSIVIDKPENLPKGMTGIWLSTDNGIDHMLFGEKKASEFPEAKIIVYKRPDGLKGEDFCSNSGFQDSKSRIWWGSVKSLTMLDASKVRNENSIPIVQLDNIYLEQKFIDFRSLEDSITNDKPYYVGEKEKADLRNVKFTDVASFGNYPEDLELPYDINDVTFNFSALEWNTQHKIRYQYILEGVDKEWNPITSEGKAVYTNLSDGRYTFKVKVKGFSDIWSPPFEYSFVIHPPWWQTIWADLFYFVLFISLATLVFKWRTKALLVRQKELEQTIVERTADVVQEKNKVEEKNEIIGKKQKEIVDSINYAKRIQYSLLAHSELLNANLPEHFVLFKPKDIVSGDFYWATKKEDSFYLAVCDSTGHGVPGAFMSLLNISFLNEAINEKNILEPNEVLNYVRNKLIQNVEGGQDGMDATLIRFEKNRITYASAHNKPVLVRNTEAIELPADKMPVGKGVRMDSFALQEIHVQKGDILYFFTDGYADQFGGPAGKKFKYKNFKTELLSINDNPMKKQSELLEATIENWKGNLEQVDDIAVVGIRI